MRLLMRKPGNANLLYRNQSAAAYHHPQKPPPPASFARFRLSDPRRDRNSSLGCWLIWKEQKSDRRETIKSFNIHFIKNIGRVFNLDLAIRESTSMIVFHSLLPILPIARQKTLVQRVQPSASLPGAESFHCDIGLGKAWMRWDFGPHRRKLLSQFQLSLPTSRTHCPAIDIHPSE